MKAAKIIYESSFYYASKYMEIDRDDTDFKKISDSFDSLRLDFRTQLNILRDKGEITL
jgi:hypothetical protein